MSRRIAVQWWVRESLKWPTAHEEHFTIEDSSGIEYRVHAQSSYEDKESIDDRAWCRIGHFNAVSLPIMSSSKCEGIIHHYHRPY